MALGEPIQDRRARRHQATKDEIVDAAWAVAREKGLAAVSLADVAARVGMRVPSLYSYFASKHDIYDAMFQQGNEQFLEVVDARMRAAPRSGRARLSAGFRMFFDFCTEDPVRYELLFQRTIPGFVPSETSYAKAVEVLARLRAELAELGLLQDQSDEDLVTALSIGIVDQQISNDPGGRRWEPLVEVVADLAYDYLARKRRQAGRAPAGPSRRKDARGARERREEP